MIVLGQGMNIVITVVQKEGEVVHLIIMTMIIIIDLQGTLVHVINGLDMTIMIIDILHQMIEEDIPGNALPHRDMIAEVLQEEVVEDHEVDMIVEVDMTVIVVRPVLQGHINHPQKKNVIIITIIIMIMIENL